MNFSNINFGDFPWDIFLIYFLFSAMIWFFANYFLGKAVNKRIVYLNQLKEEINSKIDILNTEKQKIEKNKFNQSFSIPAKPKVASSVNDEIVTAVENKIEKDIVEIKVESPNFFDSIEDKTDNVQEVVKNELVEFVQEIDTKEQVLVLDEPFTNIESETSILDLPPIEELKLQDKITADETQSTIVESIELNTLENEKEEVVEVVRLKNDQIDEVEIPQPIEEPILDDEIKDLTYNDFDTNSAELAITDKNSVVNSIVNHQEERIIDDLKLVEGIGFKIQEILNSKGIYAFEQLAEVSADQIKAYLEEAGPRYSMHDPTTWPDQAKLARDGEWPALRRLQDSLDKGRIRG